MGKFKLGTISEKNLNGVHPDLVRVVRHAIDITGIDFRVIEGVRNMARQRDLVRNGKSKTLVSRHLTGHAVDLAPLVANEIPWNNWDAFEQVACAMQIAATECGVALVWGGEWQTFRDGPHFELCRKMYP